MTNQTADADLSVLRQSPGMPPRYFRKLKRIKYLGVVFKIPTSAKLTFRTTSTQTATQDQTNFAESEMHIHECTPRRCEHRHQALETGVEANRSLLRLQSQDYSIRKNNLFQHIPRPICRSIGILVRIRLTRRHPVSFVPGLK